MKYFYVYRQGKNINDEDRMRFSTDDFYLKSPEEMIKTFKNIPEAISNTVKVANMCNVELEFGKLHLPHFQVPEGQDSFDYLRKLCYDGLKKLYKDEWNKEEIIRKT